jgi:hypothetical protein
VESNVRRDRAGVLSYTVAIRSLDGSGPQKRGVRVAPTAAVNAQNGVLTCNFPLTNTGKAGGGTDETTPYLKGDVYRVSAEIDGKDWTMSLPNALATANAGHSTTVPVHAKAGTSPIAKITLTATSESDPTKKSTATCIAVKR